MRSLGPLPVPFLSLLVAVALLFVAACGDDDEEEEGDGGAAAAPELEDGTLQICSDIAYAPMEFYPEGSDEPDGFDVDLGNALAQELGVEAEWINTGFDGIIGALQTEECDAIMSAMTATEERREEVDFVEYLNVGTGILVPAGNPENIQSLEDLCGLTVAVQLGTTQEQMAREIECEGGEEVNVVTFDTNPLAVQDLRGGGADANLADFPVALLDAQESDGALEVVETQVDPAPYGIAIRKDSDALEQALQDALDALRENGTYDDLLAEWGLESARLD